MGEAGKGFSESAVTNERRSDSTRMGNTVEKIVEFIKPYFDERHHGKIAGAVEWHIKNRTFDYALDGDGEMVAVVLWTLTPDKKTANIRELIIRPDWKWRGVYQDFLLRAIKETPSIETITFKRLRKGNGRLRRYSMEKFIRRALNERQ